MYDLIMNSRMGYLLQVLPFALLTGAAYLFIRWRGGKMKSEPYKTTAGFLAVCYGAGLLALVWTPSNFWTEIWYRILNGQPGGGFGEMFTWNYNMVPSVFRYLSGELTGGSWTAFMTVGNVLMFVPMGVLLPLLWKGESLCKTMAAGFTVSLVIELGQPVFGRSFDVDDLISNTAGALVGYLLYFILHKTAQNTLEKLKS